MIRKLNKKEIAYHNERIKIYENHIKALKEKEKNYCISCEQDIKKAERVIRFHKGNLSVGVKIVEKKGKKYESCL